MGRGGIVTDRREADRTDESSASRAAERAVADAIEEAVSVPSSIEEQAPLDAAELEEIEDR